MQDFRNLLIVLVSTATTHKFSFEPFLDGVTATDLFQQSFLYPFIGWAFLFIVSRTLGVILKKMWRDKVLIKFNNWRKKHSL